MIKAGFTEFVDDDECARSGRIAQQAIEEARFSSTEKTRDDRQRERRGRVFSKLCIPPCAHCRGSSRNGTHCLACFSGFLLFVFPFCTADFAATCCFAASLAWASAFAPEAALAGAALVCSALVCSAWAVFGGACLTGRAATASRCNPPRRCGFACLAMSGFVLGDGPRPLAASPFMGRASGAGASGRPGCSPACPSAAA